MGKRRWFRAYVEHLLLGATGTKPTAGALREVNELNQRASLAKVVLVDDVMTSGATSDACVRALKRAGAERVIVACFARVLDEAL